MPRENMISFIKKSLIGAVCVAVIGGGVDMITKVYSLDKMVALLNYKVTIIMNHVAPEANEMPTAKNP